MAEAAEPPFKVLKTFGEVVAQIEDQRAILVVDMPIGLSASSARRCDRAAREFLGSPRNNSVFSAPCRATLAAVDYRDACRLNNGARGKGLSKQCFGILPKMCEVDACLNPERQHFIREAHPEVTFAVLSGGGRGLLHPKKTHQGEMERLALLGAFGVRIDIGAERARLGLGKVGRDDLVDALACLATAQRIYSGEAITFPVEPEYDERGLRMEIVA